jgi:hypothetical protein
MNRVFSGRAITAAEQDLLGAMPTERDTRIAELVYEAMSSVNRAADEIRREAESVKREAEMVLSDLDGGLRIRYPVQANRLAEAIAKRQAGFDLLVSLLGPAEVQRYQEMSHARVSPQA